METTHHPMIVALIIIIMALAVMIGIYIGIIALVLYGIECCIRHKIGSHTVAEVAFKTIYFGVGDD